MSYPSFGVVFIDNTPHIVRESDLELPALSTVRPTFRSFADLGLNPLEQCILRRFFAEVDTMPTAAIAINILLSLGQRIGCADTARKKLLTYEVL